MRRENNLAGTQLLETVVEKESQKRSFLATPGYTSPSSKEAHPDSLQTDSFQV
jgi:hypothetical protein